MRLGRLWTALRWTKAAQHAQLQIGAARRVSLEVPSRQGRLGTVARAIQKRGVILPMHSYPPPPGPGTWNPQVPARWMIRKTPRSRRWKLTG